MQTSKTIEESFFAGGLKVRYVKCLTIDMNGFRFVVKSFRIMGLQEKEYSAYSKDQENTNIFEDSQNAHASYLNLYESTSISE